MGLGGDRGAGRERKLDPGRRAGTAEIPGAARDGFTPFLASLKDIQTLLGLDLTATTVKDAAPLVTKAQANAGHSMP